MKIFSFILFFFIFYSNLFSDEIRLKDGSTIKGKVLRVSANNVEYDPEGDIPFDMVPRSSIKNIVYDNDKIINFDDSLTATDETDTPDSSNTKEQKSSWYLGFGLGSGDGAYSLASGNEVTFDDWFEGLDTGPKIAIQLGVGAIILNDFHLGFDMSALSQNGTYKDYFGNIDAQLQINNYLLSLSYFPYTTGLFIKAGLGASVISSNIKIEAFGMNETYNDSFGGFSGLIGAGYYIWLGDTFNLGINLEYSHQEYEESSIPRKSNFWSVYTSFYWF
ncbi:MAG: autotransporter outer membrane beta-barrel domain-containing protein [Spirochaetia bacterium]|nr:autotransporter outer membrane beta-barrel domain-containing protein [Spirochaetia bacterium]